MHLHHQQQHHALTFQCHPPSKTSWTKNPCTIPPWHINKSTLAKKSSDSTYLPSKFAGGLGRGCFALAFGTWHRPVAWANNPNKRFFSKQISPWYFFTLTNNVTTQTWSTWTKKMSAWMSPFPFWMSPRITLPIQSPPNQPKTNLKCYPFAVREKGMFLLVTSQTFVFRDVLIWSYVRPEHWLKLIWKSFDTLFLGCQMALWKRRI